MKTLWKLLIAAGIIILSLTVIALRVYPRQTIWTGEYIDIYEGQGYVKEYDIIPASGNPQWVKDFQRYGAGALVGGLLLLGTGIIKLKKL